MADHNLPTITSTYSNFVTELDARLDDVTRWLSSGTPTNLPDGAVKWDTSALTLKKWASTTSTWGDLSTAYNININGTVGATSQFPGKFTDLTATGTTVSLPATATVGNLVIVSLSGTQTLTNKTLTSPIFSTISNTGTITLPTTSDTLIGRATTDTLTNKTLTTPKMADAGFIADPTGNAILTFGVVASAVNGIKVTNATTANTPVLEASGTDTNINFNIKSKGTGTVQANGYTIANLTGVQTLTNKTMGTSSAWNGNIVEVGYGGTGTSTAPTAGGIAWGSSTTAIGYSTAGTAGQVLKSNGTGAPTWIDQSTIIANGVQLTGAQNIAGIKTFTSQSQFSSGSATAPSIAFTADGSIDTGFYWISDGVIGVATNGFNAAKFRTGNLDVVGDINSGSNINVVNQINGAYLHSSGNIVADGSLNGASIAVSGNATVGGAIVATGDITAFSDARIKANVTKIENALEKVGQLGGYTYDRTDIEVPRQTGVIAQEVLKVLPEAVHGSEDTLYTVAYGNMVGLLIEAIKELNTKVESLQSQLNTK